MTDIHAFDQLFAGADDYLTQFVAKYQEAAGGLDETENLRTLTASLQHFEPHELAPLLAAAIRRLARAKS